MNFLAPASVRIRYDRCDARVVVTGADIAADAGEQRRGGSVAQVRANVPDQVLAFDRRRRVVQRRALLLHADGRPRAGRRLAAAAVLQRSCLRHVQVRQGCRDTGWPERERVYLPQNKEQTYKNILNISAVAGYQKGKSIKLVAYSADYYTGS